MPSSELQALDLKFYVFRIYVIPAKVSSTEKSATLPALYTEVRLTYMLVVRKR